MNYPTKLPTFGALAALGILLTPAPAATIADPIPTKIPHGPIRVELKPVAEGLVAPNLLIPAPGDTTRLFIVDQNGQVRLMQNGKLVEAPFLDVANDLVDINRNYDERGLLGLAFDPGFADASSPGYRRLFTYTSEKVKGEATFRIPFANSLDHHSVVASWKVDPSNPNKVDPASRMELMRIDQPQMNHNGGMMAFGPDGFLYIALGDGGGANDNDKNGHNPELGNAQDMTLVHGKFLRIDVNGKDSVNGKYGVPSDNPFVNGGGVKEIFASGFRNPWRFSFDGAKIVAADVGQNKIEEVVYVEKGKNYGWRLKEGTFRFDPKDGSISTNMEGLPKDLAEPVLQYDHDEGISITGGFVYRGKAIPELAGKYVFADYSKNFSQPQGRLFYGDLSTGETREFILAPEDKPLGLFVKGFGQDADGELYVMASTIFGVNGTSGVALKILPAAGTTSR
jgi:glucose/arabinose dehydrogenase